jgi:transposase-like protein
MKNFNSILELAQYYNTEAKCRKYFEKIIWDDKPVCPHCGNEEYYRYSNGRTFKCKTCKKKFTVTVGTIFEGSHIPLQKWLMGSYLLLHHSKGISSVQLSKDLAITQKSAWYMAHRLRYAIRSQSFLAPLAKTVEMDETFIGGKERNKHASKRGLKDKTVVFGMVERETGEVRTQVVPDAKRITLYQVVVKNVDREAVVITDEANTLKSLFKHYKYLHFSVNHSQGEYTRGKAHTNTIEGFWSLFKRSVLGIYHQISPKHTNAYLDESEFRYNNQKKTGQNRIDLLLNKSSGYLSYKDLIKKA